MSGGEREPRGSAGLQRKAWTTGAVIGLIALAVGSIFGDGGFLHLHAERARIAGLALEVDALREENTRLAAEVRALRSQPRAVERVAREQLGLARPGEWVFVLRDAAPPAP